ncbi:MULTISPECIES: phosphatase PAP2 family protein [unclassified Nostoc]|uniref:phosphatase PAP2 family protein n=1 Tax=unclassified Nostoc TaxID=2593658 RepID=UPI002AD53E9F|nr:phosphatase PAP2 family protein [Nostoc sp. DedQUE03]MDZ7970950.1 phosphatase PAP2 family protein [Nostoc sp. DedQUE03]MDZ8044364.1 phosphatase PAP2 family protein [Nostoc sp. DedQUE02]
MGTVHFNKLPNENHCVQAIHTAVKGRARYKVNGLYHSETLKRYLESRLLEQEIIFQARANSYTGNVLVIFSPEKSLNAIAVREACPAGQGASSLRDATRTTIAQLIEEIVLDYWKKGGKLLGSSIESQSVKVPKSSAAKENVALVRGNNRNIFDSAVLSQISETNSQFIPVLGAVCALVGATGLLYAYNLDEAILLLIQKLHTPLRDRIMLSITFLGDPVVMLISSLGLAISPLYYNRHRETTILGIAGVGAILLNCLMKLLFGRARPALWKHIINVGQHSFPSGHAMVSIVIYGFTAYILAKQFPQWRLQIYALTVVLIAAIGFSRLYLGVHWLTDVTAGYGAGLVWLIVCILSLELQQKSRLSLEYKQNLPILSSN